MSTNCPRYDVKFKLKAVAYAEKMGNNSACGRKFGVSEASIRKWIKEKHRLLEMRSKNASRGKTTHFPILEVKLMQSVRKIKAKGVKMTEQALLREVTRLKVQLQLKNCKVSAEWIKKFMNRYGPMPKRGLKRQGAAGNVKNNQKHRIAARNEKSGRKSTKNTTKPKPSASKKASQRAKMTGTAKKAAKKGSSPGHVKRGVKNPRFSSSVRNAALKSLKRSKKIISGRLGKTKSGINKKVQLGSRMKKRAAGSRSPVVHGAKAGKPRVGGRLKTSNKYRKLGSKNDVSKRSRGTVKLKMQTKKAAAKALKAAKTIAVRGKQTSVKSRLLALKKGYKTMEGNKEKKKCKKTQNKNKPNLNHRKFLKRKDKVIRKLGKKNDTEKKPLLTPKGKSSENQDPAKLLLKKAKQIPAKPLKPRPVPTKIFRTRLRVKEMQQKVINDRSSDLLDFFYGLGLKPLCSHAGLRDPPPDHKPHQDTAINTSPELVKKPEPALDMHFNPIPLQIKCESPICKGNLQTSPWHEPNLPSLKLSPKIQETKNTTPYKISPRIGSSKITSEISPCSELSHSSFSSGSSYFHYKPEILNRRLIPSDHKFFHNGYSEESFNTTPVKYQPSVHSNNMSPFGKHYYFQNIQTANVQGEKGSPLEKSPTAVKQFNYSPVMQIQNKNQVSRVYVRSLKFEEPVTERFVSATCPKSQQNGSHSKTGETVTESPLRSLRPRSSEQMERLSGYFQPVKRRRLNSTNSYSDLNGGFHLEHKNVEVSVHPKWIPKSPLNGYAPSKIAKILEEMGQNSARIIKPQISRSLPNSCQKVGNGNLFTNDTPEKPSGLSFSCDSPTSTKLELLRQNLQLRLQNAKIPF